MDRLEIVVPMLNGEDVLLDFTVKMAFSDERRALFSFPGDGNFNCRQPVMTIADQAYLVNVLRA